MKDLIDDLRALGYHFVVIGEGADPAETLGPPDATSGSEDPWTASLAEAASQRAGGRDGGFAAGVANQKLAAEFNARLREESQGIYRAEVTAEQMDADIAPRRRSMSPFPPDVSITGEGSTRFFIGLTAVGRTVLRDVMPYDAGRFGDHYVVAWEQAEPIAKSLKAAGVCN